MERTRGEKEEQREIQRSQTLSLSLFESSEVIEARSNATGAFECKTCGRRFASFQALGGHRTSHNRVPRARSQDEYGPKKRVVLHECAVCGLGFSMGQALGGHMRRHRAAAVTTAEVTPDLNLVPPLEDGRCEYSGEYCDNI